MNIVLLPMPSKLTRGRLSKNQNQATQLKEFWILRYVHPGHIPLPFSLSGPNNDMKQWSPFQWAKKSRTEGYQQTTSPNGPISSVPWGEFARQKSHGSHTPVYLHYSYFMGSLLGLRSSICRFLAKISLFSWQQRKMLGYIYMKSNSSTLWFLPSIVWNQKKQTNKPQNKAVNTRDQSTVKC